MSEELPDYVTTQLKKDIVAGLRLNGFTCVDCLVNISLEQLTELARDYYSNKVVDLDVWRVINRPLDTMVFNDAFYRHLGFIEELKYLLSQGRALLKANVVSKHRSKSIILPVIMFEVCQVKIYMRYNFHNWTVSVDSPYELEIRELFKDVASDEPADIYCEGFKDEWKFGNYNTSHSQFTLSLPSDYYMHTLIYLLDLAIRRVITKKYKRSQSRPSVGEVYTADDGGSPIQIISVLEGVRGYIDTTYTSNAEPCVEFNVYVLDGDRITTRRLTYDEIISNYTRSKSPRLFK